MANDDFDDVAQPETGDRVSMDTFLNKLVIVRPVSKTDSMKTEFKPDGAEAVFVNIAIIDGHEGEPYKVFRRVLVMQGYLVGAFKNSIGGTLLGTIHLGERKTGQKPPFKFMSLKGDADIVAKGKAWMAAHAGELAEAVPEFGDAPSAETQRAKAQASSNPYLNRTPSASAYDDEPPF